LTISRARRWNSCAACYAPGAVVGCDKNGRADRGNRCTEGFDTRDLKEAKALLEELSAEGN
jgi:hypothetical protein